MKLESFCHANAAVYTRWSAGAIVVAAMVVAAIV